MIGQSKSVYEADADSACELMDFFRYNSYFVRQLLEELPGASNGTFNRIDYRPLEGFVFAVTPFNFTAIGGNLPTSPAMVGNTVIWKPASTAIYSNYFVMKLLQEAGLPSGVINFVPGSGREIGPVALEHPALAGVHFTGSTATFNSMWKTVVNNIGNYTNYPRIVGETGGKDFIFAHLSADTDALAHAIIAGGFSYQGQKCSASSRVYIPEGIWEEMQEEIFGPVVTIYVYPDADYDKALNYCETTSQYALTGAIFAKDRYAIQEIEKHLRYAAGNLYINDKTTGAFVGLQPFGGARASGTNEKVGSKQNISRWMSPRTIKENFNPSVDYRLPLMQEI